jgi:hypothetical protein
MFLIKSIGYYSSCGSSRIAKKIVGIKGQSSLVGTHLVQVKRKKRAKVGFAFALLGRSGNNGRKTKA